MPPPAPPEKPPASDCIMPCIISAPGLGLCTFPSCTSTTVPACEPVSIRTVPPPLPQETTVAFCPLAKEKGAERPTTRTRFPPGGAPHRPEHCQERHPARRRDHLPAGPQPGEGVGCVEEAPILQDLLYMNNLAEPPFRVRWFGGSNCHLRDCRHGGSQILVLLRKSASTGTRRSVPRRFLQYCRY